MIEAPIVLNPQGSFPGLIVVDHAGIETPTRFGALDLPAHWRQSHHFCDLGIEPLARAIAQRLDIPIIMGTVSRLVIDLNRWIDDPRSIPEHAEGLPIPGNTALPAHQKNLRQDNIFWPYHTAINEIWQKVTAKHNDPFFFALHSCTRHFDGMRRPWDGGTIWNEKPDFSTALLAHLAKPNDLTLGDNQPYSGKSGVYTLDRHTWGTGHRACGFEVCNDLIETSQGHADWADRLVLAFKALK